MEGDFSEIIQRYLHLSKMDLTPHVYLWGTVKEKSNLGEKYNLTEQNRNDKCYGYIVTDYIPMTITNIKDIHEQDIALRKAIQVAYKIESLGYFNIDSHGGNFLWDPKLKKAYAIDLGDLTTIGDDGNRFLRRN